MFSKSINLDKKIKDDQYEKNNAFSNNVLKKNILKVLVTKIVYDLIALYFLITKFHYIMKFKVLKYFIFISFSISVIIFFFLTLIYSSKKFTHSIKKGIDKIFKKDKTKEKLKNTINAYRTVSKEFVIKKYPIFLLLVLVKVIALFVFIASFIFLFKLLGISFSINSIVYFIFSVFFATYLSRIFASKNKLLLLEIILYFFISSKNFKVFLPLSFENIIHLMYVGRFLFISIIFVVSVCFLLLLLFRENKNKFFERNRIKKLIAKERTSQSIEMLYLSDELDINHFLKLYSTFKTLNITINILANKTLNDASLPENESFSLEKITFKQLRKKTKYILKTSPDIIISDSFSKFGYYGKKISKLLKAPFVYYKKGSNKINSYEQDFINQANATLTDAKIEDTSSTSLDYFKHMSYSNLYKYLINKINLYNVRLFNSLKQIKILLLGGSTYLGQCLYTYLKKRGLNVLTTKHTRKGKGVKLDFYKQKDIYSLFKKYTFDLVIDANEFIKEDNLKDSYATFLNLMVENKINYFISINHNLNIDKYKFIPLEDPMINLSKLMQLLNTKKVKFNEIGGNYLKNPKNKLSNSISSYIKKEVDNVNNLSIVHIKDFLNIIYLSIQEIISFNVKGLKINNLQTCSDKDIEDIINKNNNYMKKSSYYNNNSITNYHLNFNICDIIKDELT